MNNLQSNIVKFGTTYYINNMFGNKSTNFKNLMILIIVCVFLIIIFLTVAYIIEKNTAKKENKKIPTIFEYIGFSSKFSWKHVFIGMIANIIFGFIDNAGLFIGMDALDPYLPEGELTKAGYGNTFSDFLGMFLGTFSGNIIGNISGISETPLWSQIIGIVIGCLLGLWIPKKLTGKK